MPQSENNDYGMVGVRDTKVKEAIRLRVPLVIIAPKGTAIFQPKVIKKKFKTFKQVGHFVDNPMKLYALRIDHNGKREVEEFWFI